VVLDEAHERSLNTDILFGLLKKLTVQNREIVCSDTKKHNRNSIRKDTTQKEGSPKEGKTPVILPPLKLVVTSATLDSKKFAAYFNNCPVFDVPGRTFPVEIIHSVEDHITDYETAAVNTAIDIHCNNPLSIEENNNSAAGDILIFLTGQAEIDRAMRALNETVRSLPSEECGDLLVLPLYAALPPEMQARVFAPSPVKGVRRCIVATNIAETSVTVDGVVYVIDPGTVKQKDYNPRTGMESLTVVPISRVQAAQRAGRAGRTRPGRCYRLYTKRRYEMDMPSATLPEIQRTSLLHAVLYLKSLSENSSKLNLDVLKFDFLDPPQKENLVDALRQLYVLDAIDSDGNITPLGKEMAILPLDPSLARALLAAKELNCLDEMLTVASMLSPEGSVFLGNKGPEQLVNGDSHTSTNGGEGYNNYNYNNQKSQHGQQVLISQHGRYLLNEMMVDGLGDHILLLRLWQGWTAAGCSTEWCRELGVDARAMRFARDVRRQLENVMMSGGGGGGGQNMKNREDDEKREEEEYHEKDERNAKRAKHEMKSSSSSAFSSSKTLRALRKALTIGFANRVARRMPLHNGYRTLASGGETSTLAQIHPSAARLASDEDGMLPEWVVYHELISTGRVFLSGVCPVEGRWVAERVLPKLQNVDIDRLSGGGSSAEKDRNNATDGAEKMKLEGEETAPIATSKTRNDSGAVDAARARYLARKAAKGGKK
jgi:ATP-dependent RNA helicase DHX8/PRP22